MVDISVEARPMSFEEYLELPDEVRAEYVDGCAIVNPPPSFSHQMVCQRLLALLDRAVEGRAVVVLGVGWQFAGPRPHLRIPDLVVLARAPEGPVVTDPPLICVEVLSTNRSEDLVRKYREYLAAGVQQYWVVDPRDRVVDVHARGDAAWRLLLHLDAEHPAGTVDLVGLGTLDLSLTAVLG